MTSLRSKRLRRSTNFRASSKGHAFDDSAASRKGADDIFFLFELSLESERLLQLRFTHVLHASEITSKAVLGGRVGSAPVGFFRARSSPNNAVVRRDQASPPKSRR